DVGVRFFAHHRDAMGSVAQRTQSGDVIGVQMRVDGLDQPEIELMNELQIAVNLFQHRIDDQRFSAMPTGDEISVGAGYAVEKLAKYHRRLCSANLRRTIHACASKSARLPVKNAGDADSNIADIRKISRKTGHPRCTAQDEFLRHLTSSFLKQVMTSGIGATQTCSKTQRTSGYRGGADELCSQRVLLPVTQRDLDTAREKMFLSLGCRKSHRQK